MSPVTNLSPASTRPTRKEAAACDWRLDTISDEQLLALHQRLERLAALGDTFADVSLSAQAKDRLRLLLDRADPSATRMS